MIEKLDLIENDVREFYRNGLKSIIDGTSHICKDKWYTKEDVKRVKIMYEKYVEEGKWTRIKKDNADGILNTNDVSAYITEDLNLNNLIEDFYEERGIKLLYYPSFKEGYCYGVCDNIDQIVDYVPEMLTDETREFIIITTPIYNEHRPEYCGWRWHKWGPYICNFEPKHEYLNHEEGIERVLVFHIFELEKI